MVNVCGICGGYADRRAFVHRTTRIIICAPCHQEDLDAMYDAALQQTAWSPMIAVLAWACDAVWAGAGPLRADVVPVFDTFDPRILIGGLISRDVQ